MRVQCKERTSIWWVLTTHKERSGLSLSVFGGVHVSLLGQDANEWLLIALFLAGRLPDAVAAYREAQRASRTLWGCVPSQYASMC